MKNLILCLIFLTTMADATASIVGDSLRIMSYNVRNGLGMDGKRDYKRVAAVISKVNPDVIALQELDSVTKRSSKTDVLEQIARHTGMNHVYGAAINYDGGKYGIGILSKEKPLHTRTVPLPGREEGRVLLIAEFENYIFLATHFSLTQADQIASVDSIVNEIKTMKKPIFLAGDMNSTPDSSTQKAIQKHFKTFTDSNWITCNGACIDYIYGYRDKTAFSVINKVLIEDYIASDHCPVFIDIRF